MNEYWIRKSREVKQIIDKYGDWRKDVLIFQWNWAGHILRDKDAIAHHICTWRSMWEQHTHRIFDRQRRRLDPYRNPGRFSRWEMEIFFFMETKGKMWMDEAKNITKENWNSYAEEFAEWRLNNQLRDRRLVAEHLLRSQPR